MSENRRPAGEPRPIGETVAELRRELEPAGVEQMRYQRELALRELERDRRKS